MGVKNLSELFSGTPIDLSELTRKVIAVDAYNIIYQFLASIRGYDGSLLTDMEGTVTSHLSGLLYRNTRLLEKGIRLVYVFDGEPSKLKREELRRRAELKRKAREELDEALERGDYARARVVAQRTSILTPKMVDDSKKLLSLLGIPVIEAPQEGEAQSAYLVRQKKAWASASQDYDSFLFGCPILIRNLTLSGRRKLPHQDRYVTVNIEMFRLQDLLQTLDITREQLIDLAILLGTDFNPDGVKGVGPKTAYKLIKKHGNLETILEKETKVQLDVDYEAIREIFLNPVVTDKFDLHFSTIDVEGVVEFLCEERGFNKERVLNAVVRAKKGQQKSLQQRRLDAFFG
ncbi:MAG: flap endonuclease-1 [Candidatus Heimdallarchaeaceae archaeon]